MMQYKVFCANDQKVTAHDHLPDRNGEVLLQCSVCGRYLKFPAGIAQEEFIKMLDSLESINKLKLGKQTVQPDPLPIRAVGEKKQSFLERMEKFFNGFSN